MSGKTLCIDFDGVLHSYSSGWRGPDNIPDPPVPGALKWLVGLVDDGFHVCIFSSRSQQQGGIGAMQAWLIRSAVKGGVPTQRMIELVDNHLDFPPYKPAAFLTIDDRCICFTGEFPSREDIDTFKPWHAKDV